jgi:hypothetical protein
LWYNTFVCLFAGGQSEHAFFNLKKNFSNYRTASEGRSGDGMIGEPKWQFWTAMSFLHGCMAKRERKNKRIGNYKPPTIK